jgi:hypothetical protein
MGSTGDLLSAVVHELKADLAPCQLPQQHLHEPVQRVHSRACMVVESP